MKYHWPSNANNRDATCHRIRNEEKFQVLDKLKMEKYKFRCIGKNGRISLPHGKKSVQQTNFFFSPIISTFSFPFFSLSLFLYKQWRKKKTLCNIFAYNGMCMPPFFTLFRNRVTRYAKEKKKNRATMKFFFLIDTIDFFPIDFMLDKLTNYRFVSLFRKLSRTTYIYICFNCGELKYHELIDE